MIRYLFGIFLILGFQTGPGQSTRFKGSGLGVTAHYGQVVKHTEKILFEPGKAASGFTLDYAFQTYGKRSWHAWRHYPRFGVSLQFWNLGNEAILGKAYALVPHLQIPLFRKGSWEANFFIGPGIGYLTRSFHPTENPQNNAVGSNLNNATQLRLLARYALGKTLTLSAGCGLAHFSNGSYQLPNYGINIGSGFVGIQYTPDPVSRQDLIPSDRKDIRLNSWGLDGEGGLAWVEKVNSGGPKHAIWVLSVAGLYQWDLYNRSYIGTDVEWNRAVFYFGRHTTILDNSRESRQKAMRYTVFAAQEFLYGRWGIHVKAGTYINRDAYLLPAFPLFLKLSTRYYLPEIVPGKVRTYAAVSLKTHKFDAEYISFGIGLNYNEKTAL